MLRTQEDYRFIKIRDFAEHITNYQLGDTPIVVELSPTEARVGKFYVHRINESVWRADNTSSDDTVDFCNKKNAMFYSLFMSRHRVSQAVQLRSLDEALAKLQNDLELIRHQMANARKTNDAWTLDLSEAKLACVRDKYRNARIQIKKWFDQAKYYKIQELQL